MGARVGEGAFEAVSDLHPDAPALREEEENDAVRLALLSHAPGMERAIRELFERRSVGDLPVDPDEDLVRRFALERRELLVQARGGLRRDDPREIREVLRGLRRRRGRARAERGARKKEKQEEKEEENPSLLFLLSSLVRT